MKNLKKRKIKNRIAHWIITSGGVATILVILTLFVFIFLEVYPLLKGAKVIKENRFSLHDKAVSSGVDEHLEVAYVVYENGTIEFLSLRDGSMIKKNNIRALKGANITAVGRDKNRLVLGTEDGRIVPLTIEFSETFEDGTRTIVSEVTEGDVVICGDSAEKTAKATITQIVSKSNEEATVHAVCTKDGRLLLLSSEITQSLFGPGETQEFRCDITGFITHPQKFLPEGTGTKLIGREKGVEITSLALDLFLENLYVGTSFGEIIHIDIRDRENPSLAEMVKVSQEKITSLCFLLGDISLVVGDIRGGVNVWMQVRVDSSPTGWALKKIHTFQPHNSGIIAIAPSKRDKGFITAASDGSIHLKHATTERTLLQFAVPPQLTSLTFSQKANGIFATTNNRLFQWHISNPHPETTLKTLFGKVWYEGYEKPEFVWQSTGGSDDFEPKLSLVPLIFGTIKGTMYALIFAVPIGILGALYTSQFLHNSLKMIKPVIEIMAALPSVILGFLAGLWLAPLIEGIFPAVILTPFFVLLAIILAMSIWKYIPVMGKGKYSRGTEVLFLIPFVIAALYISIQLGDVFESFAFGGDFRGWLFNILGLHYDQRNAVVVGFAMGFAVIPLVFTISEDAMSNVPKSLVFASLALGATPWQTAVRIVLPAASPAIFSAVMIGFGRAVGETMIVLMATGNTPIMEWNLFNGFRALAANIAVEIPEAPFRGTLYRVLFLASLLLFVTTFIVNTFAEVIRQKMKQRYSKL